nr:MAG TPA: hypothetical protein [Caudoviricetes sp.]DAS83497.1 MAG TPA: hypothetical protein [Caudoviricetes sp.]
MLNTYYFSIFNQFQILRLINLLTQFVRLSNIPNWDSS